MVSPDFSRKKGRSLPSGLFDVHESAFRESARQQLFDLTGNIFGSDAEMLPNEVKMLGRRDGGVANANVADRDMTIVKPRRRICREAADA